MHNLIETKTFLHPYNLCTKVFGGNLTLKFSVADTRPFTYGYVAGKVFVVISFPPFQLAADFIYFGSGSAPDF